MIRCTGHCCKSFCLPFDPMQLKFQAKLAKLGKCKFNIPDMLKVADMVIYQRPNPKGGYRYTCKYFDKESGNCCNYENRPNMCKDYPYGKQCTYKGCTMKENNETSI